MKVGYIRCSTEEQNEARQVLMMQEHGCEKLFIDKLSGKNMDRPQLKAMLEYVREGDIVIVESISRLSRSTRDLLVIVGKLEAKHVTFISLKEQMDTSTPQGRFVLTIFAALAELERENILQRQAEGIAIAKAEGKYKGRKPISIDEERFKKQVALWRAGKQTATQAFRNCGLTKTTFYRKVQELQV